MSKLEIVYTGAYDPTLCDGISGSTFDLLRFLRQRGHAVGIISFMHDSPLTRQSIDGLADFTEVSILSCSEASCHFIHNGVDIFYQILPGHTRSQLLGCHPDALKCYIKAIQEHPGSFFFTVDTDITCVTAHYLLNTRSAHFVRSPAASIRYYSQSAIHAEMLKKRTVFTLSKFSQQELKNVLHLDALVWPPLIDASRFRSQAMRPDHKTIGYYSAGPHKGDHLVQRLIQELPGYRFVIMGHADAFVKYPNVTCLGKIRTPEVFYGCISLLLVPSIVAEGYSRTIIEASFNGIPVIANRIGGIPEALEGSGILIDVEPSEDVMLSKYVAAITAILDHPGEYEKYHSLALERARTYEKTIDQISTGYDNQFFAQE
jgi:glycosyltransferase involved in cell wall biosynthesis